MSEVDGLGPGEADLPRLPGFREMALRRMAGERRRLVGELTAQRQAAGLSQTQVAARMGTSQSAVARLEAGEADVRASTLERYAAAIGSQISWRLQDAPAAGPVTPTGRSRPPGQHIRASHIRAGHADRAGYARADHTWAGPARRAGRVARAPRARRAALADRTATGGVR